MDKITQILESPDEEIRLQGMRELAAADPEQNLNLVFLGFGDKSWRVRKEAIELFLRLPLSRDLVGEVIELLHAEENAGLRNAAVEILVRLGRHAVPMLIDQARCSDHDVRKFIIDILGDIADNRAIPVLVRGLTDEDSNVRAAAAENLGKLKATEGVPALLDAMGHPDLLLQFTILDALSRIGTPVDFSRLAPFKNEKLLRKALVDCLGKVGDASSVDELIRSLVDPMRNVRESAVIALSDFAERFPDETRRALRSAETGPLAMAVSEHLDESGNVPLQRASIRILGWMTATDAIVNLLGLLDNEGLQQESLAALIDIGVAHPESLIAVWSEVDNAHRAYLAYIFGEAGCRDGLAFVQESLDADDIQLQRMSAYALGKLDYPEVLPDLVRCLHQSHGDVQDAATQALICLGKDYPEETLEALKAVVASADPVQRRAAVTIIGRLQGTAVADHLSLALKDPDAEVRRAAVKAFEGRDTTDYLSNILLTLTDEDAEVRRTAVEILSASCSEEACDGLQLALQDEDIWVRSAAVRGLGRLEGAQVRHLIESAINDPVGLVSIAALETLVDLAGGAACPNLVAALDHPDEEVVSAALNLLPRCDEDDWLPAHTEDLINHPFWAVRSHFARYAAQMLGRDAVDSLQRRLDIEKDELVRQQLMDLLDELRGL